jgi:hypothetical protein
VAKVQRKRNLFGFGKSVSYSTRLVADAFSAGKRSGDTARFKTWLESRKEEKLSRGLRRRLEKEYRRGVESLWTTGHAHKDRKGGTSNATPLAGLRADVASALMNQGMGQKKAEAIARRAQGGDFESMFRSVMKKNPEIPAFVRHLEITSHPAFRTTPAAQAAILAITKAFRRSA